MNTKINGTLFSFALILSLAGCSTTAEKPEEVSAAANAPTTTKYPVTDRLEYMRSCIQQHDHAESATTPCGCKIDRIAEKMTFMDYVNATTFKNLSRQSGDNGAAFRDPAQSKDLRKELKEAEAYGEKSCFGK